MDTTHAPAQAREMTPSNPDGILDMRGPNTLDGGYSPSQDMSSAMARAVVGRGVDVVIGEETTCAGIGANALEIAMIAARMRIESLAIFDVGVCQSQSGNMKQSV